MTTEKIKYSIECLKQLKHYVLMPPLAEQVSLLKQTSTDKSIDSENIFNSLTLNSNST
jgi:hypothetical protein